MCWVGLWCALGLLRNTWTAVGLIFVCCIKMWKVMLGPCGTEHTHWQFEYLVLPDDQNRPGGLLIHVESVHSVEPLNRKLESFHGKSFCWYHEVSSWKHKPESCSGASTTNHKFRSSPTASEGRDLWHVSCREPMNRRCYTDCILPEWVCCCLYVVMVWLL